MTDAHGGGRREARGGGPPVHRTRLTLLTIGLLAAGAALGVAEPPPPPTPDAADPNIFYGRAKPGAGAAPVLVFVHGLAGVAYDWWVGNDMYEQAYQAGFRSAFISLSPDNTRNHEAIGPNAEVLRDALPKIAARYRVSQFYVIAHSKGGVDVQAALLDPRVTQLAKAVFTIATPNSGTELADWAFGPGRARAEQLDALLPGVLLSPGLYSLRTASMETFRRVADPYFRVAGIPFYTIAGDTALGNPLMVITGRILEELTGGGPNDGLVPVARTRLPTSYAVDLGDVAAHHFRTRQGSVSFWRIAAEIEGLESVHRFQRVATDGFGDPDNSWPWFAKWFKGHLYVGTGRAVNCVTFATAFAQTGLRVYPPPVGECPGDIRNLRLAAEIWRYTPQTRAWRRVYKSPEDVPIGGRPMRFAARDIGFRGAAVFTEPGGETALYVSGVSASSLFEDVPRWARHPQGYPPPRILRSVDGVDWQPVPQRPGTFLGDIVKNSNDLFKVRGFRTMEVLNGQLFVVMTDYRGVGVVIASARPWEGNDAWRQVSPPAVLLPVWTIRAFNGFLYAGTGDRRQDFGYGVWKTDAVGLSPAWLPVVTRGGWQSNPALRSPNVLNMLEFKGRLYVGTDRPTELIRVNPDDSWDLIVGARRLTPDGMKKPLSTITTYFGNTFNGHFWNFGVYAGSLYLGTWDWSVLLRSFGLVAEPFRAQFGFNLYRSEDGESWSLVTHSGFGNPWNYGVRSLEATPFGFFVGAAKPQYGLDVWLDNHALDLDGDGDIDQRDVDLLLEGAGPAVGPEDPRDIDRDGWITSADASLLATQCTRRGCPVLAGEPPALPSPRVHSASRDLIGRKVLLQWLGVPGAARYRVYKQPVRPLLDFVPEGFTITLPILGELTLEEILGGALDFLCEDGGGSDLCAVIDTLKTIASNSLVGFPDFTRAVEVTRETYYYEDPVTGEPGEPDPPLQSIYFVRAEDVAGRLSPPSNIVGGPSEGPARGPDPRLPTISAVVSPPPNEAGWNRTDVTVTWEVRNAAFTSGCEDVTLSGETPGTDLVCRAANLFGTPVSRGVTVRIDKTPPSVAFGAASPVPNRAGWNNTDVSIPFQSEDALSGVSASSSPSPLVLTGEGTGVFGLVTVTDVAGNGVTVESPRVSIDRTPPTMSATRFPEPDDSGWNSTAVAVTFECDDALSGVFSCGPRTQVVSTEGPDQFVLGTAFDRAGNVTELTVGPIHIAGTAQEVFVQLDPASLELLLFARDARGARPVPPSSTTPVCWIDVLTGTSSACAPNGQRRLFVVRDGAGNTLEIGDAVQYAGQQVQGRIESIARNGAALPVAANTMRFGWRSKDVSEGFGRLEQRFFLQASDAKPLRLNAEYYRRWNETRIEYQEIRRKEEKILPGLVLLRMAIDEAGLRVEHDP